MIVIWHYMCIWYQIMLALLEKSCQFLENKMCLCQNSCLLPTDDLLVGFHANLPAWLRRLEHSLSWFKLVLWNLALCIYIYEEVCLLSLIKAEEPSRFENQRELFSCPCKEEQLYFALTFWLMCSSAWHVSPADFTSHMSASVRANFLPFVSQAKGRSWEQRAIMDHGSLRAIISS